MQKNSITSVINTNITTCGHPFAPFGFWYGVNCIVFAVLIHKKAVAALISLCLIRLGTLFIYML
jgi:hypothetical protein